MPVALFLSPHLDDAAFSCAEPMLSLQQAGWEVVCATVFTASVASPEGFALACQLDKGLAADVDYMALRRAEDRVCMERLGVGWRHLDLCEAPHRGYDDVGELFGPVRSDDTACEDVARALHQLVSEYRPTVCFAPLAIGHHVDHRVIVDCLSREDSARGKSWIHRPTRADRTPPASAVEWPALLHFADQPYAAKNPNERDHVISALGKVSCLHFSTRRERRQRAITAIEAYTTQVPFQFGSTLAMQATLGDLMAQGTSFWQRGEPTDVLNHFLVN